MDESKTAGVAPYTLAMVVADGIWRDPSTGKRTILGCFSEIGATKFPFVHPQLAVYVAMTDVHGKVAVKLRMVHAENDGEEPLFEREAEVELPDPRVVVEMDFTVGGLVFPRPGQYRLQLLAAGEFLLERRIVVRQMGKGHQPGPA